MLTSCFFSDENYMLEFSCSGSYPTTQITRFFLREKKINLEVKVKSNGP